MNPIAFNGDTIALLGKYGKLITAVIGLIVLPKSPLQFKRFISGNIWLLLFWGLCIIFLVVRTMKFGFDVELIQNNVLFMFFIYFIYLLSSTFRMRHQRPYFYFFKYLAVTLNINFLFWLVVGFIFGFNSWSDGTRVGLELFYDSYITLGILACTAAIANFVVFKYRTPKKGKMYFALFYLYLILVILANSRNAQLILGVFLTLSFFPYFGNTVTKNIYFLLFMMVIGMVFYFTGQMLLNEELINFTSGRSTIWYYIYEYYLENSLFLGESIFGLNETILIENRSETNYYFNSITTLYFHSSYIEVLAAGGIFGLLFFVYYLVQALREMQMNYTIVVVISILGGGIFESYLLQPTILIAFMFWYLIIGETRVTSKKKE